MKCPGLPEGTRAWEQHAWGVRRARRAGSVRGWEARRSLNTRTDSHPGYTVAPHLTRPHLTHLTRALSPPSSLTHSTHPNSLSPP